MTASQIREAFLAFFEHKNHLRRPSSSLLPDNDPSVLLTTAGMQQFKPYFLGQRDPIADFGAKRVTTIQKCFRTSDIDEVGDDSHLTFFEMLGNFSFGDYFKAEAIEYAWEFLTKELKIAPERLFVTIFAGDDAVPRDSEAEDLWKKYLPAERIVALGRKDNFWGPPGTSGSCGPSSEIHVQLDPARGGLPGDNSNNFLEIWNLVFTEYDKSESGEFTPLPQKNIDTGMGLERLAMIVQGKTDLFATDVYQPILEAVRHEPSFGLSGDAVADARRTRIVADHFRAVTFLLADGVAFSNKDQGYILRRIFRRAADQFLSSDIQVKGIIDHIIKHVSAWYPELTTQAPMIHDHLQAELEQYQKILSLDVESIVKKMRKTVTMEQSAEPLLGVSSTKLDPIEAFTLYATHGVSVDRLQRLGFQFNRAAVEEQVAQHQALSRSGAEKKFGGHGLNDPNSALSDADRAIMTKYHTATHLLHAALRRILGPEVTQQGSDITAERLRFDFSFHRALTTDEKKQVELMINDWITQNIPVTKEVMSYDAAIAAGATAFFKDKYGDEVTVYSIGDMSKELCGGPHVERTGAIGTFTLQSEQSVGRGVRRIKGRVG